MNDKKKAILKRHLDKLEEKDFDLDAWKSGVSASIKHIFPDNWALASQLENLKIENSSWTLRDSGADYNPLQSAKKKGRALLESAIDELELNSTDSKTLLSDHFDHQTIDILFNTKTPKKEKLKLLTKLKKEELAEIIINQLIN